jgi:integrase/recombinase XerD
MTAALRQTLSDYLVLRRALGFKLAATGRLLEQFVDYLEQQGVDTVTTERALAWATQPTQASRHWGRFGCARCVASPPFCTASIPRWRFRRRPG